jgi:hypothetical protein
MAETARNVNGIPVDGEWLLGQGPGVMIRARQNLLPLALHAELSERVVVTWTCRAPLDIGLPSKADYAQMAEFEALLVGSTQEGAILAFVVTRDGAANLNFYTRDTEWFLERLNEAFADKPPMPLTLSGEDDPEWSEYAAVLDALGAKDPAGSG